MDIMDYQTTVMVIKTATGIEEFKDFIENGVNKAKGVILRELKEAPIGLSYLQLNNLITELFSKEKEKTAAWKVDSFIVALAGLELEDKKIRNKDGIYTILNR